MKAPGLDPHDQIQFCALSGTVLTLCSDAVGVFYSPSRLAALIMVILKCTYIYIYIYMCVCVCVGRFFKNHYQYCVK